MKFLALILICIAGLSQAQSVQLMRGQMALSKFQSDGCSLSPDGGWSQNTRDILYKCCERHDVWYWIGGSEQERLYADRELALCILKKTDLAVSLSYYWGVRMGGGPEHDTSYRWGYGWPQIQPYQELSEEEAQVRDQMLKQQRYNPKFSSEVALP